MTKITQEEFNRLSPKEIREWNGIGVVARIIRYLQDGQFNHRKDALKTVNYWLKNFILTNENLNDICWVIPFLIEQFPTEKKVIRYEIAITLDTFLHNKVMYDAETKELITTLLKQEKDKKVKIKLGWIINWYETLNSSKYFTKDYYFFRLKDKSNRSIIIDNSSYQDSLSFKPRRREKVKPDDVMCVYFLQEKEKGFIKIGKTKNLKNKTFFPFKMPFEWEVIHTIKSSNVDSLETFFHKKYQDELINGEWFHLSAENIKEIKNFKITESSLK